MKTKRTGLIMEGGAMRGMFTCGVIDVLMENGIEFDGAIGVSAGAAFGCNYKSRQIGRAIRYNKRFCNDKRYVSIGSLLKTGDLYNADFCYRVVPDSLDVFGRKAFQENPMEFYVVCTDAETGHAVYHKCTDGGAEDIRWIQASASLPLVSKTVEIGDSKLLDGGIADSIPIRYFEQIGYDRNVVILTQPMGYIKERNKYQSLMRIVLKKYPAIIEVMAKRHEVYNEATAYIRNKVLAGELFVICPDEPLKIGKMEKNPDELERVYQIGRNVAEERLDNIKTYIKNANQ